MTLCSTTRTWTNTPPRYPPALPYCPGTCEDLTGLPRQSRQAVDALSEQRALAHTRIHEHINTHTPLLHTHILWNSTFTDAKIAPHTVCCTYFLYGLCACVFSPVDSNYCKINTYTYSRNKRRPDIGITGWTKTHDRQQSKRPSDC